MNRYYTLRRQTTAKNVSVFQTLEAATGDAQGTQPLCNQLLRTAPMRDAPLVIKKKRHYRFNKKNKTKQIFKKKKKNTSHLTLGILLNSTDLAMRSQKPQATILVTEILGSALLLR